MQSSFLRRTEPVWIALASLALLLLAQRWFEIQVFSLPIGIAALAGLAGWAWCVTSYPPPHDELGELAPGAPRTPRLRWGLSAVAGLLALAAWGSLAGNQFNALAVWSWLGAIVIWLLAWWPWQREQREPISSAERRRRWLALALVLAITAFGGWLRFHRLAITPNDMTQDHGWKLLDIQTILDGGRPLFFPNNTGREPGQFYYTALLIRLFDLPADFMALKIGNGIVGTLTIPAIYLFAREVGGRKLGVLAAALYAIGKWPLVTTRMGLRYPYATLPAALILWSLWRYARRGERRDALLVGVWMGLGLYGYIGIRVMPVAIAVVLALLFLDPRRHSRPASMTLIGHSLLLLTTTALIFLPLGHFMLEFHDQFWYRVATRAGDAERDTGGIAADIGVFIYNNVRALAAFNWRGDRNEVNTVQFDPFLDVVTAALLLAALPVLMWRLFYERSLRWLAFTACIPITLLATTLSIAFPIENPSTARTGIVMPLIFTLAAAPLALLASWMLALDTQQRDARLAGFTWRTGLTGVFLAMLLATSTQQNYGRYFRDLDRQYRAFIPNTGEIARAIQSYVDRGVDPAHTYVLDWDYWLETRNLGIHLGDIFWADRHVINKLAPLPQRKNAMPLLFVLNNQDARRRSELWQAYPDGQLERVESEIPSKWFYLFYVPARPSL